MSMKKLVAGVAAAVAITTLVPGVAGAEPANGRFCAKADAGKTAVHNGTNLTCVQDGNRYRWRPTNGATPAKPATPAKTAPAAPAKPATPVAKPATPAAKPAA